MNIFRSMKKMMNFSIFLMIAISLAADDRIVCDADSDCFYLPQYPIAEQYLPALVVLNCTGASAEDLMSLIPVADSLHMILATCHASMNHRDVFLNDQDIMETYGKLVRNYRCDMLRVFIYGFSGMGVQAMMSLFLHASNFRGVFAVCAHRGAMRFAEFRELEDNCFYLISRDKDWNLDDNRQMHSRFQQHGLCDTLVITIGEHVDAGQKELLDACIWLLKNTSTE
jgi:hypothetical protein